MLFSRRQIRSTARTFAALLAALWIAAAAAPCVMANADCHDPGCAEQMLTTGDAAAMLNCELPDPNPPATAGFSSVAIAPMPMVVALLPLLPAVNETPPRQWLWSSLHIPFTPLNLKHARLLI